MSASGGGVIKSAPRSLNAQEKGQVRAAVDAERQRMRATGAKPGEIEQAVNHVRNATRAQILTPNSFGPTGAGGGSLPGSLRAGDTVTTGGLPVMVGNQAQTPIGLKPAPDFNVAAPGAIPAANNPFGLPSSSGSISNLVAPQLGQVSGGNKGFTAGQMANFSAANANELARNQTQRTGQALGVQQQGLENIRNLYGQAYNAADQIGNQEMGRIGLQQTAAKSAGYNDLINRGLDNSTLRLGVNKSADMAANDARLGVDEQKANAKMSTAQGLAGAEFNSANNISSLYTGQNFTDPLQNNTNLYGSGDPRGQKKINPWGTIGINAAGTYSNTVAQGAGQGTIMGLMSMF